jgi:hypothetical protein
MTDGSDVSEGFDPVVAEAAKRAAEERQASERQAFTDKLAKRSPPDPIERAEIEKARKRTKARARRVAMRIEDRGAAGALFTRTIPMKKGTATGLPTRSEPARCNSFIRC